MMQRTEHRDGPVPDRGAQEFSGLSTACCPLPQARLTEWLAAGEGTGVCTLALAMTFPAATREVSASRGAWSGEPPTLVVIAPPARSQFYPRAALPWGMALSHTLLLRPSDQAETLWALEQSLRSRAVDLTVCWLNHLDGRAGRRLQLASECGGGRGVLFRPASARHQPTWADLRLLVQPVARSEEAVARLDPCESVFGWRRLHVQVLYQRSTLRRSHPSSLQDCCLEINHATGDLRLVSSLADSTPAPRASGHARSSGCSQEVA
jgi:hypothetical protein